VLMISTGLVTGVLTISRKDSMLHPPPLDPQATSAAVVTRRLRLNHNLLNNFM